MAKITHVVGPKFFGYANAIADNLEAVYINELFSDNFIVKILIRIRLGFLFGYFQKKYFDDFKSILQESGFVSILFVDIEFVPLSFLSFLEINNIPFRIYFWDSVKNKPIFKKYLNFDKDKCLTFDYLDSTYLKIPLINLFAENQFQELGSIRNDRGVFVGTLHSSRPQIIKKFIDSGFIFDFELCHFFYYNRLLATLRAIFIKYFRYFYLKGFIRYNSISKIEINRRFNKCAWVLDVAHIGQSGLTSRTFEGLCSGSIVYTNNVYSINLLPAFKSSLLVYDTEQLFEFKNSLSSLKSKNCDYTSLRLDFFCKQFSQLFDEV
jgi:hypothetical protein